MAQPTSTPKLHRLRWQFLVILTVLGLVLAACSADGDDTTSDTASDAAATTAPADDSGSFDTDGGDSDAMEDAADDTEAPAATQGTSEADDSADEQNAIGSGGGTPPPLNTQQLGREIIFTATINVGVDDVSEAGEEATQIIGDIGGFVFGQNTQGGAEPRSTIVFKVRPEDFSEALSRLGGIGELRNQTVTTDDVTERVVDLESRIEVADLGVQRLREAMENTTTLTDFAELEQLLLNRESDLEVMRGQLRTLRDRIDLATITLTLEQDRVNNSIGLFFTLYEGHDDGIGCPGQQSNQVVFEPGDEITMCFESRNTGDQSLNDVHVTETVLGIDGTEDLITVFGETDNLQPGQSVIQAYELTAERDRALRLSVTGTPTDGVTEDAAGPAVRAQGTPVLRINEDAVDADFSDGFDAASDLLRQLWIVVVVLVGFTLPLLILLPILWVAWLLGRGVVRWNNARTAPRPPASGAVATPKTSAPAPKPEADRDADDAGDEAIVERDS